MRNIRSEIQYADIGEVYEKSPVGKEALRLGVKVVDKLVQFEVPPQTLWVPESLYVFPDHASMRNPGASRYAMHCVDSGQAWQITEQMQQQGDSTVIASRTAIDNQGRVFKKWVEPDDTSVHDGQPIEGIVNPRYIDPSQAIKELKSETFEAGIISLLGKRGIHRTIIDLSPSSREPYTKTPGLHWQHGDTGETTPKSNESLTHPTQITSEDDILALLIRKQTETDDAKARAEARTLADLQSQIDQLTAKYQQIHASTLERMRHLPADDKRWLLLTLDDGTQLPAMLFCKKRHGDGDYHEWDVPYFISYGGDIYENTQSVKLDPMKPYDNTAAVQYNMQTTIHSYTSELELLQKFHDSLPAIKNPASS